MTTLTFLFDNILLAKVKSGLSEALRRGLNHDGEISLQPVAKAMQPTVDVSGVSIRLVAHTE